MEFKRVRDLMDQILETGIPGCNTSAILAEYGYTLEQIKVLLDSGTAVGI